MKKAILLLGTFNSGSTAWAGALHRLGVDMCPPFFIDKYEPKAFRQRFDAWWQPAKCPPRHVRMKFFEQWADNRPDVFAVKHPLLSIWAGELAEVLTRKGYEVEFVELYRYVPYAIRGLRKRNWVKDPKTIIHNLRTSIGHYIVKRTPALVTVPSLVLNYNKLLRDPEGELSAFCKRFNVEYTEKQMQDAVAFIEPPAEPEPDIVNTATRRAAEIAEASNVDIQLLDGGEDHRITLKELEAYAEENGIKLVDPKETA